MTKTRKIGDDTVGAIGLGCMGMSYAYGAADDHESIRVLNRALELGVNHWDTADLYGAGQNELLLAQVLKDRRAEVFLATKFGNVIDRALTSHRDLVDSDAPWIVDGTPEYVKKCCDASLKRLGVDHIDLYYQHRVDKRVPIEDTVGAMSELVQAGKVRFLGLSEASAATLRRAAKVHRISALQSEYSLWTRDPEPEVLPAVRELGATFVPYSPLGRGFLTGKITSLDDLPEDDWRRTNPRFQEEALAQNLKLVERVKAGAKRKDATPGQVALAWLLSRGEDIAPIPGTKRLRYLEENAEAAQLELSRTDIAELGEFETVGLRYPEAMMGYLDG